MYDTIDPECRPKSRFVEKLQITEKLPFPEKMPFPEKQVIKENFPEKFQKEIEKPQFEKLSIKERNEKLQLKDRTKEFKEKNFKEKDKDLVERGHFIPRELRPDLTRGALSLEAADDNELTRLSDDLRNAAENAKGAKDNKDVEKPRER